MDKRLYAVAVLNGESQSRLARCYDGLRERGFIGRQTKDIPYHITLGDAEPEREAALLEQVERVCAGFGPIALRMSHIGLFGLNVVFAEPSANFELFRLQNSLFPAAEPWAPHATILIDEPEAVLRALPLIVENLEPFDAVIVSVALYEFFPLRFVKQIPLI